VSGKNALGREVREYIAIGANGGPVLVQAYAPDLAPLGNLPMAGLISTEGNTKASPTVVSFLQPHGLTTGDTVYFTLSNSLPIIDGPQVVTVIDSLTFSVPVNTLVGASSNIKSVSQASPASIDTVAAHGIVNGDTVVIAGSDGVPTVNGSRVATKTDGDTFTVPVNTNATQQFAISSITKASPAIVTTTTPHLLKAGATNMLIAGTDSVPTINNAAQACTYIDATKFSVAVDVASGSDFDITSASLASPSVFVTAAHSMVAGTQAVTVSGCDRVPDINGVKTATYTGATGFTIPSTVLADFTITGISEASPTVVTVAGGHSLKSGTTTVAIAGTNSTPALDGATVTATYVDATTFTVAVEVTVAGTAGTVTYGRAGGATGKINYGRELSRMATRARRLRRCSQPSWASRLEPRRSSRPDRLTACTRATP
jgi:hypothetical protein